MNILSTDSAKREVKTGHHTYILETLNDGHTLLSGHPQYCPEAVEVNLMRPLQPGSCLWFLHPVHGLVRTSRIKRSASYVPRLRGGQRDSEGRVHSSDGRAPLLRTTRLHWTATRQSNSW